MPVLRQILAGTAWTLGARWAIRLLGLISTVFLARLLSPFDFGLIAMAMFVVSLAEVASQAGLELYVIRHPDPGPSELNTMWTLHLMIGVALAVLLFLLAPAFGAFFQEPRVATALQVLALRPLLTGLENPGIVFFRREMTFDKDFTLIVTNKVVSFFLTLGLAYLLRSYWALVCGIVAGNAVSVVQSYRLHPYRPRFDLSQAGALWRFSSWILLQNLLRFLNLRVDEVIIGRFFPAAVLGYYSVASDVASIPVEETVQPIERVLFPSLTRVQHSVSSLNEVFRLALSGVAVVTFSASSGLALVAGDVVRVFLGQQWLVAVPLLRILALGTGLTALLHPVTVLLNAAGREKAGAMLSLVRQLILVGLMLPCAMWAGLQPVALARLAVALASFVAAMALTSFYLRTGFLTMWTLVFRPAAATAMMTVTVLSVQVMAPDVPSLRLALSILAGTLSYGTALTLLWHFAGRPDGIERELLGMVVLGRTRMWQRIPAWPSGKRPFKTYR